MGQAVEAVADGAGRPGRQPPRRRRRGGLPARAQPEGRPGRSARRARACGGPRRPRSCCSRVTTTPSRRPTTCCSVPGSSCTAWPAGPVTCSPCRTRTPWPRDLGYADADAFMAAVATRGPHDRLDERRGVAPGAVVARPGRRAASTAATTRSRPASCSATVRCTSAERARPADDPTLALRVGDRGGPAAVPHRAALASTGWPPRPPPFPDPWPAGASDDLVALLLEGTPAIPVLESLDQRGLLVKVLPEWEPVRSRPQRNAYHRFTVDRHLWETAANAAALADRVDRPDLLVVGALLHDLGKGYPGDHTEVGIELVERIAPRMGFGRARHRGAGGRWSATTSCCPTSPPGATSSDDATIEAVAEAVGEPLRARAAGRAHRGRLAGHRPVGVGHLEGRAGRRARRPGRASGWAAARRARVVDAVPVGRGAGPDGRGSHGRAARRPTASPWSRPTGPGCSATSPGCCRCTGSTCSAPRPTPTSRAWRRRSSASRPTASSAGSGCVRDLERALAGQLALEARLAERARTYARRRNASAQPAVPQRRGSTTRRRRTPRSSRCARPTASACSTASPRRWPTSALDIRHARVQTLGHEVVDTFYVRDGVRGEGHRRLPPRRGRAGRCCTPCPRADSGLTPVRRSRAWRSPITLRGWLKEPSRADFTRDLLRWSESLAGIARTGLGFTQNLYERERFEEVLQVAGDIKAAAERGARGAPGDRSLRAGVDGLDRRGRARLRDAEGGHRRRRGQRRRRDPARAAGRLRASGCTRPGGPTSATRRPRSRSRRSRRRPASTASRCGCSP